MEETGGAAANTTATSAAMDNCKIEDGGGVPAGTIKIKVSHGSSNYEVFVPPQSTFADLKRVIAPATGLEPEVQTVLFRGKEKDDQEHLDMVGVKDNAKVVVMENSSSKDKDHGKIEEVKENNEEKEISRGSEAVARVREENDELAERVASLEAVVCSGTQVADKDFIFLTEMLMRQLLKLDGIDAEGEGKVERKAEVRHVQALVEKMDDLRAKNSNLSSNVSNSGSVTAENEGTNSQPSIPSSTVTTQDWQVLD